MKKKLLITLLFISTILRLSGQAGTKDFIAIGDVSDDLNMKQVEMRYSDQPGAYRIIESNVPAIDQIINAMNSNSYQDLHLFVRVSGSELIFNSDRLSVSNAAKFSAPLGKLKNHVSGQVIIHCAKPMDHKTASELETELERLAGIDFIITI